MLSLYRKSEWSSAIKRRGGGAVHTPDEFPPYFFISPSRNRSFRRMLIYTMEITNNEKAERYQSHFHLLIEQN